MFFPCVLCVSLVFRLTAASLSKMSAELKLPSAPCPTFGISTIAGTGSAGFAGDGGAATSAKLNKPYGVWGDGVDSLYIADYNNRRVRLITLSTGIISTFAGNGDDTYEGDGGLAVDAAIRRPIHMIGGGGKIFIADRDEDVIRVVDSSGYISTFAGTGARGYNGDGIAATSAEIDRPATLYADTVNNQLYFTEEEGCRLRRVDLGTGLIYTVAGLGTDSSDGDGGLAKYARVQKPRGLWLDSSGNIYIGATNSHRVRMIDAGTGIITTIAGTGDHGNDGDGGDATAARFLHGLTVGGNNDNALYVLDLDASVLRRIDTQTNIITTVAGTGSKGFDGSGSPAVAHKLDEPRNMWVDAAGDVYIADSKNHIIRKVT
ncbi:hypothetical protein B484DRAFT_436529, partial [Ochromonadaceae sp. CCMP2298]